MEVKKNESVDIERIKWASTLVGFLFISGVVLASFTFETPVYEDKLSAVASSGDDGTVQVDEQEKPPEPEETPEETVEATPPPTEEVVVEENKDETPKPAASPPPPPKIKPAVKKKVKAEIIDFPDVEAAFPGGAAALQSYIVNNIQYPETSIDMDEQGKVYLSFVVGANGKISQVKIERGVSNDLDREAKRVVRSMPNWVPGEASGKKVATRCRLPIVFTLN
jgi:protein TonB